MSRTAYDDVVVEANWDLNVRNVAQDYKRRSIPSNGTPPRRRSEQSATIVPSDYVRRSTARLPHIGVAPNRLRHLSVYPTFILPNLDSHYSTTTSI